MPRYALDDLIIPTPPYRMARPVASLAASQGEAPPKLAPVNPPGMEKLQRAVDAQLEGIADPEKRKQLQDVRERQLRQLAILKGDKQEKKEPSEKSQQEKDREHVQENFGIRFRNREIERQYPDVAAQGVIIINSGTVLLEKSKTPEGKPVTPVAAARKSESQPATGYEAELGRMKAKQAELRAQGKEKEADAYDEGIKKYEDWKRQQSSSAPRVAEKPKAVAEVPKISPVPDVVPKKVDSIESPRPVPVVKPSEEVSIAEALDAQVAPAKPEPTLEAPPVPAPKVEASPGDVMNIKLTPEQREKLEAASERGLKEEQDLLMRPREQAPVERATPIEREVVKEELPENPSEKILALRRAEQGGAANTKEWFGPISRLKESGRLIAEKSGINPWREAALVRFQSLFPRRFAEVRMMQQLRAQNKEKTANERLKRAQDNVKDSGFPMRLYYASRVRKWSKRQGKWEGRINEYDALRMGWQNRHDNLQKQVISVYERELAPYRGIVENLKKKEQAAVNTLEELRKDQLALQKALADAAAPGAGKWLLRPSVREAVGELKRQLKDKENYIAKNDKILAKIRVPLARAQATVDKWEGKKKGVANMLAHPEVAGLSHRRGASVPESVMSRVVSGSSSRESAASSQSEYVQERMKEMWSPDEFVKAWNLRAYEPTFANPGEFNSFVQDTRVKLGMTGVITKGELLQIAEAYFRENTRDADMRNFKKSAKLFVSATK